MGKILKLGMVFDENNTPDFGSIIKTRKGDLTALGSDITKLNTVLTNTNCSSLIVDGDFSIKSGDLIYIADYKTAETGAVYMYDSASDMSYDVTEEQGGGGGTSIDIGIINHGNLNWLYGTGWRGTRHPGSSQFVYTDPSQIYSLNNNHDIYINGLSKGHIRQAFTIPYVDTSKTKFKAIVTVQKNGTYNCFGMCVGDSLDTTAFDGGYYATEPYGIRNATNMYYVSNYWEGKDVSVTRAEVEIPLNTITTGNAVIFMGQCYNYTTIHEMWFE